MSACAQGTFHGKGHSKPLWASQEQGRLVQVLVTFHWVKNNLSSDLEKRCFLERNVCSFCSKAHCIFSKVRSCFIDVGLFVGAPSVSYAQFCIVSMEIFGFLNKLCQHRL